MMTKKLILVPIICTLLTGLVSPARATYFPGFGGDTEPEIKAGGKVRLKVKEEGNVGVGTTSPIGRLSIKEGVELDTAGTLSVTNNNTNVVTSTDLRNHFETGDWIRIINTSPVEENIYKISTIDISSITLDSVYIGTTDSDGSVTAKKGGSLFVVEDEGLGTRLEVNKQGDTLIDGNLTVTGTSTLDNIKISTDAVSGQENHPLNLRTWETSDGSTQNRITITADGKLGIGTSIPSSSHLVDITGDTNITGDLDVSSVITPGNIDFSAANHSIGTNLGANNLTLGGANSTIIVPGDMDVQGTSTVYNTQNLDVLDKEITVNVNGTTALSSGAGILIKGDAGTTVGYMRVDSTDNSLLEFKSPTSNELILDIDTDSTLTVTGNTTINQDISTNAGPSFAGGLTIDTTTLHVDAGNNRVGVGTASPTSALQIEGTDALRIPVGTATQRPTTPLSGQMRFNSNSGKYEGYDGTNWGSLGEPVDVDGDTKIQVEESANENKIRFDTAGSERLIIDETGNVGIGTSAPSAALEVASGKIKAAGGLIIETRTDDPETADEGQMWFRTDISVPAPDPNTIIANTYLTTGINENMTFQTNAELDRMVILTNGNVGIGTSSPLNLLDLKGGAVIGATYSGTNTAPANGLLIEGNVGIGTSSPAEALHVTGNLKVDGTSYLGNIEITTDNLSANTFETTAIGLDMSFKTDETIRMTITDTGEIGIGTATPSYPLHVTGDVGFTGTLQSGTVPVVQVSGLETIATSGSYNDLYDKPPANDLTQTEVDNLRTAKLDDGTTPWDNADNITSGTLNVDNGGTGQASFIDGELLIGNSTGNTLTKATLTGTDNELDITNGNGSITLSLPNSVHLGSSGKVGRDGDNLIDFSAENKVSIRTNSVDNRLVVDAGGNVGVGTDTPGGELHVFKTLTTNPEGGSCILGTSVSNPDSGECTCPVGYTYADGNSNNIYDAGECSKDTNGLVVKDGNVGVGTTAPTEALEVTSGKIKATGGLVIETRTDEPTTPSDGQIWLRTDL